MEDGAQPKAPYSDSVKAGGLTHVYLSKRSRQDDVASLLTFRTIELWASS
jgi:hypothetical protein